MRFSKKEIISIIITSIIVGIIVGVVFGVAIGKTKEYNNLKDCIEIVRVYDDPNNPQIGLVDINWSPVEMTGDGHLTDADIEAYEYYK